MRADNPRAKPLDLRLYALLDPEHAGGRELNELAWLVAAGGATLVQLRDKHSETRAMIEEARALKDTLTPFGIPLLINDRVDVALAAGADGVHVGQDDMAVEDARRLLGPDAIIGLSIKTRGAGRGRAGRSPRLRRHRRRLRDHLEGQSRSADRASPGLARIVEVFRGRAPKLPLCAIAGIDATNAGATIAAGADGVAVISALSLAANPPDAARELRAIVDGELAGRARRVTAIAVTIAGSDSGGGAGIQARPEDLLRARCLRRVGHHRADRAEHARRHRRSTTCRRSSSRRRSMRCSPILHVGGGEDRHAVAAARRSRRLPPGSIAGGRRRSCSIRCMVASSGDRLLAPDAVDVLKRVLIPRALVLTPNLPEAAALLDAPVADTEAEMRAQAERACSRSARETVVLKGGHGSGADSVDLVVDRGGATPLSLPRIATTNTHGTGCTFSAALAAGLAKGQNVRDAARVAKHYVHQALAAADRLAIGGGNGPLHHFHAWW